MAPRTFRYGDKVELKVNKLTSVHTQLPYDYYSLPFCEPAEGKIRVAENLGEVCPARRTSAAEPRQGVCGDTLSDACAGDARRPRDELGLRRVAD